jgi:hypothetical protein
LDGHLTFADAVKAMRNDTANKLEIRNLALDAFHTKMLMDAWQVIYAPIPTPIYAMFSRRGKGKWTLDSWTVCPSRTKRDRTGMAWSTSRFFVQDIVPGDEPGFWHMRIKLSDAQQGTWYRKKNTPSRKLDRWLMFWLERPGYVLGERGEDETAG